ncbi:hypothetical protein [Actinomadura formosensis]|uniref:hypothetical protein n=1 Tax=Actinomadura formosensis TaxID=60706 RepID=UPI000829B3AE|nr:hypothetical protein [Actinomadura formosensis]
MSGWGAPRLAGRLLKVGWAAGKAAHGGRVRFVALTLASLVLTVGLLALACTAAVYDGRERRDLARSPLPAEAGTAAAVGLWAEGGDTLGGTPVTIVQVVPLDASAAPPPGLSRWPGPGEVFLSPALADRPAYEHVRTRYGRYAGRIGAAGIASPSELFAYVQPANADRHGDGWIKIAGFGGHTWSPLGERLNAWPLAQVLATVGGLTGLPCLALVVVAARCGSAARDRRSALLETLGAGRRHRALMTIGEASPPALLGVLAGGALIVPMMFVDVPLPVTGYVMGAFDIRAWAWAVPPVLISAFVIILLLAVGLHKVDRTGRATRPRSFASRVPKWRLAVFAVSVSGIVASSGVPGTTGLMLYIAATVVMWSALPSAAAAVGRRFGGRLATAGLRRGRAERLIAGRWIAAHPGVIVRLATALVIGLGLITQIQVWTSRLNEPARAAVETSKRVGDQVLIVDPAGASGAQVQRFLQGVPQGFETLRLTGGEGGPVTLTGTCAVLMSVRLNCGAQIWPASLNTGDARIQELVRWRAEDDRGLRIRAVPDADYAKMRDGSLVLIGSQRGEGWRVQQLSFAVFGVPADGLGIEYGGAAATLNRLGDWIVLFGGAGILVLLPAAATSAAAEFLQFGTALAPLAVQTERRSVYLRVALWNLTVPLWLATLIGGLVTACHGLFFVAQIQEGWFSWGVLGGAMTAAAVLALAIGVTGGVGAARAAGIWRPAND